MFSKELTLDNYNDFLNLMQTSESSNRCMCMWWIIPVKDYHNNGHVGNAKQFYELLKADKNSLGILIYDNDIPIGWCACGPRKRYIRAIKTPTFKGRDESEDETVWLIPCFYIRNDYTGKGIVSLLIEEAIKQAKINRAKAIEAFPYCTDKRINSGDIQVGFDKEFQKCGFKQTRKNSEKRIVVRLDL
jgi:hypothetical protein